VTTKHLVVLSAGLSVPSSSRLLADRLTEAAVRQLGALGDEVVVEVVELRDLAHEVTDHLLTGFAPEALAAVQRSVTAADGLVAVTPIFSASYSGLFKSFVDVLEPTALAGTPVLLGATGGTARHSLALEHAVRPLFAYLRAVVVPTAVFAASEDWGGDAGAAGTNVASGLGERIDRAAAELAELVHRHETVREDPFESVVPFEEQLRRLSGGAS